MNELTTEIVLKEGKLPLNYQCIGLEHGKTTYLLLHGGAGPQSMVGLANTLAMRGGIIIPIHPGFNGTTRSADCDSVIALADAYLMLLEVLDLQSVIVIGNSLGGWISIEMALRDSSRISAIVPINSCGIDTGSPDIQIPDPINMSPIERVGASFYDPTRAFAPTTLEAAAEMAENQKMLRVYAGKPFMHDPSLYGRLAKLQIPSLVLWGEADQIVDIAYGRRLAEAIPCSTFKAVPKAGHFPQIEQVEEVQTLVDAFVRNL